MTRYRKKLIEQRTGELQRLAKVLEDSGIKIDSVAWALTTLWARDMIEALIAGERDLGSDYFTRRIESPQAREGRLIRELEALGDKVTLEPAVA